MEAHVYYNTKVHPSEYHYLGFLNGNGTKWVITKEGNREPMSEANYTTATIDVASYPLEDDIVRIPTDPEELATLWSKNQYGIESLSFTHRAGYYFACIHRNTCLVNANLNINKFIACPDKFVEYDKIQHRLAELPKDVPYHRLVITHPKY
jgi:hypothetical protein